MAIVSVNERSQGRGGSANVLGEMEYKRSFLVITDTVDTSPDDVRNATGIPAMRAPYPSESRAIVVSKDPQPYGDERKLWVVEVKYSTTGHPSAGSLPLKPWNRKPRLRWGTYAVTQSVLEDRDGAVIENSAGDRFDPSLTVERHFPTLAITRYERRYDVNFAMDYVDSVNYPTIMICGLIARSEGALLTRFEGANIEVDGVECWEVNYEIVFAPTFVKKVLDQGFNALVSGVKGAIKLKGKEVTEPQLLNGSGELLPQGGTPVWLNIHTENRKDFGPLGLP